MKKTIVVLILLTFFTTNSLLLNAEDILTRYYSGLREIQQQTVVTVAPTRTVAPVTEVDPSLVDAAQKAIPSVVTIVGSKAVDSQKEIELDPEIRNYIQGLGINASDFLLPIQSQELTSGSGFMVSEEGYILTNNHVVNDTDASYKVVFHDGTERSADVVYRDANNDIAVVKAEGTYTGADVASLGDSSKLKIGQAIAAIGNAYGKQSNTVSLGNISSLNRTIIAEGEDQSVERINGVIQTDALIVQGYSGGPVIDAQGNVVGMNVAKGARSSFLIPINTIKSIVPDYLS
jgi:S1-C subfamily serine protease